MRPPRRSLAVLALAALVSAPPAPATADDAGPVVVSRVRPEVVFREQRGALTRLNFDIELANRGASDVRIDYVEMRVFDGDGGILARRYMGGNGLPGPIAMLPGRDVPAGGVAYVFNPFPDLHLARPAARVRMRVFHTGGRVQTDIDVRPVPGPRLDRLPLDGTSYVYSGNDLFSHHRRVSLASEAARALGMDRITQRFALDFTRLDPRSGDLARGTGARPGDWLAFDAPVRSPAAGRVVAVRSSMPDNTLDAGGQRVFAEGYERYGEDAGLGNYLILAVDRAYLLLSHFRQETLTVEAGDEVRAGETLGRLGFSGDTAYPHLHMQLQDGPDPIAARPLPIEFACLVREGAGTTAGAVDTGDFVSPCPGSGAPP